MGARKAWSATLVLAMLALGVSAGGDALLGAFRRVGVQHRRLQQAAPPPPAPGTGCRRDTHFQVSDQATCQSDCEAKVNGKNGTVSPQTYEMDGHLCCICYLVWSPSPPAGAVPPPAAPGNVTPSPTPGDDSSGSKGVIIGAVVGGVVGLALLVLLGFVLYRHRKTNKAALVSGELMTQRWRVEREAAEDRRRSWSKSNSVSVQELERARAARKAEEEVDGLAARISGRTPTRANSRGGRPPVALAGQSAAERRSSMEALRGVFSRTFSGVSPRDAASAAAPGEATAAAVGASPGVPARPEPARPSVPATSYAAEYVPPASVNRVGPMSLPPTASADLGRSLMEGQTASAETRGGAAKLGSFFSKKSQG